MTNFFSCLKTFKLVILQSQAKVILAEIKTFPKYGKITGQSSKGVISESDISRNNLNKQIHEKNYFSNCIINCNINFH